MSPRHLLLAQSPLGKGPLAASRSQPMLLHRLLVALLLTTVLAGCVQAAIGPEQAPSAPYSHDGEWRMDHGSDM